MSLHETTCTLTSDEWISLINKEREGLTECCGNISDLRDQVILIIRDGGQLPPWNGLLFLRAYRVALDGHDILDEDRFPILVKLLREVLISMGHTLEWFKALPHEGHGEVCIATDQVEAVAERVLQKLEERLPRMLDSREEEV